MPEAFRNWELDIFFYMGYGYNDMQAKELGSNLFSEGYFLTFGIRDSRDEGG